MFSIREALDEEQCLVTIQTVIKETWLPEATSLSLGGGGQAILKHKIGVLHVRIIAPQVVRVQRIMRNMNLTEAEALKIILENDKAGSEYLQRFYGIDWDDSANYDIVLNTAKFGFEHCRFDDSICGITSIGRVIRGAF